MMVVVMVMMVVTMMMMVVTMMMMVMMVMMERATGDDVGLCTVLQLH